MNCSMLTTPAVAYTSPTPSPTPIRRWSCESGLADHRDLQASAMAVDAAGRLILLGGRRFLAVVDLTRSPPLEDNFRVTRCGAKWDVTKIVWSPVSASDYCSHACVAFHDRVDLVAVDASAGLTPVTQLRAHSRTVTDLDWCSAPAHQDLLASCSIDAFVYLWDVRSAQRPVLSLQGLTAASQVQFNGFAGHVLASAHDGDVKLWDTRNPSLPTGYVTAHLSKVLSFDWSPSSQHQFVTSGQDCTVKFFDTTTDMKRPERVMKTSVPVWKAKYTPFGEGFATVIIPQIQRSGNSLFLWNFDHLDFPVHCFYGHSDVILDFAWRKASSSWTAGDCELISFGRDHTLRSWRVDSSILSQCGVDVSECSSGMASSNSSSRNSIFEDAREAHEAPDDAEEASEALAALVRDTTLGLVVEERSDETSASEDEQPQAKRDEMKSASSSNLERKSRLQRELDLLNLNDFHSVKLDEASLTGQFCHVSASVLLPTSQQPAQLQQQRRVFVRLRLKFPSAQRSDRSAPTISVSRGSTLDSTLRNALLRNLRATATQHSARGRPCLEPCLRQMETMLDQMRTNHGHTSSGEKESHPSGTVAKSTIMLEGAMATFLDSNVPYPRTCGASFCGNDRLVCFTRQNSLFASVNSYQSSNAVNNGFESAASWTSVMAHTPRALSAFEAQQQMLHESASGLFGTKTHVKTCCVDGDGDGSDNDADAECAGVLMREANSREATTAAATASLNRRGRFRIRRVRSSSTSEDKPPASRRTSLSRQDSIGSLVISQERRVVIVYSVSQLLPFSKDLVRAYVVRGGDPANVCLRNAVLASRFGRHESAHLWRLCGRAAAMAATKTSRSAVMASDECHSSVHPLGRPLLHAVINYLVQSRDVQMAALLACIFHTPQPPARPPARPKGLNLAPKKAVEARPAVAPVASPSKHRRTASVISPVKYAASTGSFTGGAGPPKAWFLKPGSIVSSATFAGGVASPASPYFTIQTPARLRENRSLALLGLQSRTTSSRSTHNSAEHLAHLQLRQAYKSSRSNSCGDCLGDADQRADGDTADSKEAGCGSAFQLLDPSSNELYDRLKLAYAAILFNWGMLNERCAVLKFVSAPPPPPARGAVRGDFELATDCVWCCERASAGSCCSSCGRLALRCAVCGLGVRGLASCCGLCGHGGHAIHLQQWFAAQETCPTGCGCRCLRGATALSDPNG